MVSDCFAPGFHTWILGLFLFTGTAGTEPCQEALQQGVGHDQLPGCQAGFGIAARRAPGNVIGASP